MAEPTHHPSRRSPTSYESASSPILSPNTTKSKNYDELHRNNPLLDGAAAERKPDPIRPDILQPYCFYPLNNHPTTDNVIHEPTPIPEGEWVSPQDDPGATRGIPIFRPSYEEFEDFEAYVTKTVPWGQISGIVKIVPPKEWVDALPPINKRTLTDVRIRSPIEQKMVGQNGVFLQQNMERMRNRPLTIHQWFDKCLEKKFATPEPKEISRSLDRDSKEARERQAAAAAAFKAERIARRAKRLSSIKKQEDNKRDQPMIQASIKGEKGQEHHDEVGDRRRNTGDASDDIPALEMSSHTSQSSPEPIVATPEAQDVPDAEAVDPFFDAVDLREAWLPKNTRPEDYTATACSILERRFWKTLGVGESSWYGADLPGSLFSDTDTPWNVAHLPNLLNRIKGQLPGVNSPYLYFGMWRAAFSWHVEDMDLFSINYIHFGAPKLWYAIPQTQAERFESVVSSYFPQNANSCSQFMRHKSCTVSPSKLNESGIRVNMLVHNQNEFVITYPRGYHAGFNLGFNCAESVNFALDCWIELGRRAKACQCVDFSVRIDVDRLLAEQKLVGEIEKERSEAKNRSQTHSVSGTRESNTRRKRRLDAGDQTDVKNREDEKHKILKIPAVRITKSDTLIDLSPKPPRATITRMKPIHPCMLCPSLADEDLALVSEPSEHLKLLAKADTIRAHISCAIAIPELWTEDVNVDNQITTVIKGINSIGKDRWNLKCALCPNKHVASIGAKIQCTKGKCPRAFHVSCARQNETVHFSVMSVMETRVIPSHEGADTFGPHQYEQVPSVQVELLCPAHNPQMKELKKRRLQEELREKILSLQIGSLVKLKLNGSTYAAQLLQVVEESQKVLVRLENSILKEASFSALDFRVSEPQMLENEYAGPPKRSRKEPYEANPHKSSSFPLRTGVPDCGRTEYQAPHLEHCHAVTNHSIAAAVRQPIGQVDYSHGAPLFTSTTLYPVDSVHLIDSKYEFAAHYSPDTPPRRYLYAPSGHFHIQEVPRMPPIPYRPHVIHPSNNTLPPVALAAASLGYPVAHRVMASSSDQSSSTSGNPKIYMSGVSSRGSPNATWQRSAPAPSGIGKIDLGLGRMITLMGSLPLMSVPVIHLAGTNGKGSVSAILETCLLSSGIRTARYNSPHLIEPRDAVRINGSPPSREEYANAIAHVQRLSDERNLGATTFEIGTAAAYLLINSSEPQIDVMIIECGMGGARDATNVLPPQFVLASASTSVGLDHTDRLGSTISAIAREKASIAVQDGLLVVSPHLHPEAYSTAVEVASERHARLIASMPSVTVEPPGAVTLLPFKEPKAALIRTYLPSAAGGTRPHLDCRFALGGAHQLDNLSLSLTILDVLRCDQRALNIQPKLSAITDETLQAGVAAARWEGRCSWIEWTDSVANRKVPVLVDGAHNGDSALTLRHYVDALGLEFTSPRSFIVSLSASPGKTPMSVLAPLLRAGDRVALVDFSTPVEGMPWVQPADKEAVGVAARNLVGSSGQVQAFAGAGTQAVSDALRWVASDWTDNGPGLVVVCGSLYLVADLYRLLTPVS